jgi:flagella basal body P-ring formation protein FlgA
MKMRILLYVFILFFLEVDIQVQSSSLKETLELTLKESAKEKLSQSDIEVEVNQWHKDWFKNKTFQVMDLSFHDSYKKFSADIKTSDNHTYKVAGKILWMIEIPMLTRMISYQESIQDSDIVMKRISSDAIHPATLLRKEELLGKTSRQGILRPYVPIQNHEIQFPKIIKRGDPIKIRYETPTLLITNQGIAQKDGATGDVIGVEVHATQLDGQKVKKMVQIRLRDSSIGDVIL